MFTAALLISTLLPAHSEFPGQCEALTLSSSKQGSSLKRIRRPAARAQVEEIIRAVAAEMGADPQLLLAIAQHESSMQPAALHVLPGDTRAGMAAWTASSWSETRAQRYQTILDQGPGHPFYYKAKFGMWRINRYRDNPHWHATAEIDGAVMNPWGWGYGLYGMAPVLFVGVWDKQSPPWILCDPAVATVTLVWALRAQKTQCAAVGEKGTIEQVVARYASGKCGNKVGAHWKGVLRRTQKVELGGRWRQQDAKRAELLQAITSRLESRKG